MPPPVKSHGSKDTGLVKFIKDCMKDCNKAPQRPPPPDKFKGVGTHVGSTQGSAPPTPNFVEKQKRFGSGFPRNPSTFWGG